MQEKAKKLHEIKNRVVATRLPHFIIAGVITLLVEYGTFITGFYILKTTVILANITSFILSLTANFMLNRLWVFKVVSTQKNWQRQTSLYLTLAFFNAALTSVGLEIAYRNHLPIFATKLIFITMVAGWNFVIFRKYIFIQRKQDK